MNRMFVLRQKFNQKSSRATIVGILGEDNILKVAGARCSNKLFTKKEGVSYAKERAENNPWVEISFDGIEVNQKMFNSIALKVLNNIDTYLKVIKDKEAVSA